MVIRRSSTGEVQHLLADLAAAGDEPMRREAAVARLRVLGARAVRQVLAAIAQATVVADRIALLQVLEGRADAGVIDPVLDALAAADPGLRLAAVAVARGLLDETRGNEILDRLTMLAVSREEAVPVRLAAIGALADLPARTVGPVLGELRDDPDPAIRLAAASRAGGNDEPGAEIEAAASGDLPADPQRLADAVSRDGELVALPTLHRLVTVLREREPQRRDASLREWQAVRGGVHLLLARRGSRVALYDLRETIEAASAPLPDAFAHAMADLGDAGCLEAVAAAYARTADHPEAAAWRTLLANAARAITTREKLTRRHAAVRRVQAKWGSAVIALLP